MKKKRRQGHITQGEIKVAVHCPNCLTKLTGVTGVKLDEEFERFGPTERISLKGSKTICCYCGAMLVFADDDGRVRMPNEAERARRFDPVLDMLVQDVRAKVRRPDFTRKNFN